MTGTNDERPAFRRCVADGIAGIYDVLVVYKHDLFARNVEISRKYKRMLHNADVRIVSMREGESKNTPDGFLHEGLDELFAEYYSRNLSVLIRDGMRKNAQKRKASGVRIFGYRVNEEDRFVTDPDTAPAVVHAFKAYAAGQTVNEIASWMNTKGYKTTRGNQWRANAVAKLLKRDSYVGIYRFDGIVDKTDGMPAIISEELFAEVLRRRDNLVASIAEGINPKSVKEAIDEAERRIEQLNKLIAREKFNKEKLLDPKTVRTYVNKIVSKIDRNPDRLKRIIEGIIDKVFIDRECAIILFDLGLGQKEFALEELQEIKIGETADEYGVRLSLLWWSIGGSNP